jgi:pilus assembly protein Flp/PilA
MVLRLYTSARVRLSMLSDTLIDTLAGDRGATAVEYALMLAFIFIVIVSAVVFLGSSVNSQFQKVQFP